MEASNLRAVSFPRKSLVTKECNLQAQANQCILSAALTFGMWQCEGAVHAHESGNATGRIFGANSN